MKKNPLLEFTAEDRGIIKKSRPIPLTQRRLEEITGSFTIQQKNGRYKVEVMNIREIPSTTMEFMGSSTTELDQPIEKFNLSKENQFKEFFLNHMAKPYNNLFSALFDPRKKSEDW